MKEKSSFNINRINWVVSYKARISGNCDSKKDSEQTKLERRCQEFCDSKL